MKKLLLTLFLFTLLCSWSFAQAGGAAITGLVEDGKHQPLEGITVTLLQGKDSAVIQTSKSDKAGLYQFKNVPAGKYLVGFTGIGYSRLYAAPFNLQAGATLKTLDPVQLRNQSSDLGSVTVAAKKPFIEQKIDRTVVNVEAAVTNTGASALEVLEKLPGVTVDKDGNVSLKGKSAVMIMIDGKPSYLSGTELVNLLRNMNANQLEQIELMTNPPAKYDAAGNSGIINIKTKKNKMQGFNGSLAAGYSQGFKARTNNSLNLNYRTEKINAFANLSFNENNRLNTLEIERKYKNTDGKTVNAIFEQTSSMKNRNTNGNLKAGMDFFLSKKTTVGFVASGFLSSQLSQATNTSYLKNSAGKVDSMVYSTNHGKEPWKNGSMNLNFRRQFDSTGRELTADLDYIHYNADGDQHFTNTSYQPGWIKMTETALQATLPTTVDIYSVKSDYSQTLKGAVKFEAGVKSSYVKTNSSANYFLLDAKEWKTDWSKTNSFNYTENINAAYVNFNKQFKKVGVQAGLRYENTNAKGVQGGNPQHRDSSFNRSYNNLFPTVFISYTADKKNQFGLNIGRRIDRPAYQDLNPFLFFIDNYTYESGNPYLKPQFSSNVEVSHTYKGFLTTTLNWSQTRNYFMETFEQSGYATIVRNGNIGLRKNAGVAVSAQVPVQKWWTAILYGNYNYNKFTGALYGEQLKIGAGTVLFNVNNQFKFSHGWSAELSGFYRSKGVEGQVMIQSMGQVSTGVSKQILKNKGSLKLNVRDLFYTQKNQGTINFQQTEAHFTNRPDSRVVNFTFSYRFGKPLKMAPSTRKTGGSSDEQNRVKVGG